MPLIEEFCSIYRDLTKISSSDLQRIYTDNVEFVDPITTHYGLGEVQQYFANLKDAATSCEFTIYDVMYCTDNPAGISHVLNWKMKLVLKKPNKCVFLSGTTQLKENEDGFYYHRDFYDLGEMVYEHIPVLGWCVKAIKRKLAS